MNFLDLCKRVRSECGISGIGPASVNNQTGEMARIVGWVASAYNDIQMKRPNWLWMKGEFSFQTTPNEGIYTSLQAGIATRFLGWDILSLSTYNTASGVSDSAFLQYVPYPDFRDAFLVGSVIKGKPFNFSVAPNKNLVLNPISDLVHTVNGEYYKSNQFLTGNMDEPELPEQYHEAIVYRAMMKYARYEAAGEIYGDAEKEYRRIIFQMEIHELPTIAAAQTLE
jgi:hypothetical protein